jgi:lipid-A-disaccharide synthase-like uncharacterized protein
MRLPWRSSWTSAVVWVTSVGSLVPLLWFANERVDLPKPPGIGVGWLVFGFGAQALFAGRLIVQWLATEKRRRSVVPVSFWWLSLLGGLMLLAYFWRRGDPVGIAGQLFGNIVYLRNLYFLYRERRQRARAPAEHPPEEFDPTRVPGPTLSSSRRAAIAEGANPRPSSASPRPFAARPAHSRQRQ